jgi:hypothetical protein
MIFTSQQECKNRKELRGNLGEINPDPMQTRAREILKW